MFERAEDPSEPIHLVDLRTQYRELAPEIREGFERVCGEASFILGPEVERFEQEFADFCGADHVIGVASGLDAIEWMLRAVGVGAGDEVIIPANTFVATALGVSRAGARPVPVDCDSKRLLIDVERVEAAISEKTRALLPVHLYGQPVDMDPLRTVADRYGIALLEDAAQAHGAHYEGRACGSLGRASAFSFYPGKNLGAYGDAGAVVTSDDGIAAFVRKARNYGQKRKYVHEVMGANSRLDSLQAGVLRAKLPRLPAWNEARRRHAAFYRERLADLPLRPTDNARGDGHVFHLYVVRHPDRDAILDHLADRRVYGGIHYPIPVHLQPAYDDLGWRAGTFPVAEAAAREVFSLPMYPELTEKQLLRVCSAVRSYFGRN